MSEQIHCQIIALLPDLRAFARFLARERDRADDLVQDTIVKALAAISQFTPGTNLKSWLFTILRNHFYGELRKQRADMVPLENVAAHLGSTPPAQESHMEFDDFQTAFWQLKEEHREVLILVGANGLSYEEAAAICGCAVGTVKSRVSRARGILEKTLDRAWKEPVKQGSRHTAESPDSKSNDKE